MSLSSQNRGLELLIKRLTSHHYKPQLNNAFKCKMVNPKVGKAPLNQSQDMENTNIVYSSILVHTKTHIQCDQNHKKLVSETLHFEAAPSRINLQIQAAKILLNLQENN